MSCILLQVKPEIPELKDFFQFRKYYPLVKTLERVEIILVGLKINFLEYQKTFTYGVRKLFVLKFIVAFNFVRFLSVIRWNRLVTSIRYLEETHSQLKH